MVFQSMFRDEKQRREFLFQTCAFTTIMSILVWLVPIFTCRWHMKRWYVLGGFGATIRMGFGIFAYNVEVDCSKVIATATGKTDVLVNFCTQELAPGFHSPQLGEHSYHMLADWFCNVELTAGKLLVFAGCEEIRRLAWVTHSLAIILVVSLIVMLLAMSLMVVYRRGYGQDKLLRTARAMFALGPLFQLFGLLFYGGLTWNMNQFFDMGVWSRMPFVGLAFGTSRDLVVSFSDSYYGAIGCMLFSWVAFGFSMHIQRPAEDEIIADPYDTGVYDDPHRSLKRYYAQFGSYGSAGAQPDPYAAAGAEPNPYAAAGHQPGHQYS